MLKNGRKKYFAFGVEPNSRKYRLRLARYAALAETIAGYVDDVRSEKNGQVRVLDAGSGSGRVLQYLKPYDITSRIEFHAVDNDPKRIESVYSFEGYHKITCCDLTDKLPYDDNAFDIIVCEQVLEHIQDAESVLKELVRVLSPGGLLIIGVPTFFLPIALVRRYLVPALDTILRKERDHIQVFTAGRIKKWVQQIQGLEVNEVRGFRIISGGILAPLENHYWWYRLNRIIGRAVPQLCVECQVTAMKSPQPSVFSFRQHIESKISQKLRKAAIIAAAIFIIFGLWIGWSVMSHCPVENLIHIHQEQNDIFYSVSHPVFAQIESLENIPISKLEDVENLSDYERKGRDIHIFVTESHLDDILKVYPGLRILGQAKLNDNRVYLIDLLRQEEYGKKLHFIPIFAKAGVS
jgi:SAM-dependent methyltransferase